MLAQPVEKSGLIVPVGRVKPRTCCDLLAHQLGELPQLEKTGIRIFTEKTLGTPTQLGQIGLQRARCAKFERCSAVMA